MKKNIEKLIPKAIEVVGAMAEDGKVPKVYNGYISSLGASLIQMGLLPTLAFYTYSKDKNKARSEEDRSKLLYAIFQLIEDDKKNREDFDNDLLKYALDWESKPEKDPKHLKNQIKDAAIAIKLAIRTFELDESKTQGND